VEYLKRIGLLALIVVVVFVKVNWYQDYATVLDLNYIISLLLNCFFAILLILTFMVSKSIVRTSTVLVIEVIILVILFTLSIYIPLYSFFDQLGKARADFIINNPVIINYAQMVFGTWLITFLSFSPEKRGYKKNRSSGMKKYY
jgi:presenilin-like A22 family membrane protease